MRFIRTNRPPVTTVYKHGYNIVDMVKDIGSRLVHAQSYNQVNWQLLIPKRWAFCSFGYE